MLCNALWRVWKYRGLTAWWNIGLYIVGIQYITSFTVPACACWVLILEVSSLYTTPSLVQCWSRRTKYIIVHCMYCIWCRDLYRYSHCAIHPFLCSVNLYVWHLILCIDSMRVLQPFFHSDILYIDCVWNVMALSQKPDFVFRRNVRVHLNRRERQFSWPLAAEVCASAVVMLDTLCSEVVWRVPATHSIRQFPLHFPSRASTFAVTFQLDSTISNLPHDSVCECVCMRARYFCFCTVFVLYKPFLYIVTLYW
jgi:hypothetical protein